MKPLVMLSLPNSGSTWLGEAIARHRSLAYFPEYFNPVRNPKREAILERNFGSELISCYRNIARAGDEHIDDDIRATWFEDEYQFTKEVFSPFKLNAFHRHFNYFVLLRHVEGTFPPSRARIWSFYEHAWHALREAGHDLGAQGIRERALEAHAAMTAALRTDAARLNVPVLEYESLFGRADCIHQLLEDVLGIDDIGLAMELARTRKAKPYVPPLDAYG